MGHAARYTGYNTIFGSPKQSVVIYPLSIVLLIAGILLHQDDRSLRGEAGHEALLLVQKLGQLLRVHLPPRRHPGVQILRVLLQQQRLQPRGRSRRRQRFYRLPLRLARQRRRRGNCAVLIAVADNQRLDVTKTVLW